MRTRWRHSERIRQGSRPAHDGQYRTFPETEEVLRALKANGARIGIISTKYRYRIMELMGKIFPEGFIDIIVGGEDMKEAKPSPEGLLQAASRLNCPKEQILYLGDSIVDAETAQNAGVDLPVSFTE